MKVGGGNMNLWSGKRSLILALVIWLAPSVGSCSLKTCKSVAWNEIISLIIWDSSHFSQLQVSWEANIAMEGSRAHTFTVASSSFSFDRNIWRLSGVTFTSTSPADSKVIKWNRQMEEKLSGSEPTFFHRNTQSEERKLVPVVRVVHVVD